jgi:D-alanyl-D-alanine dipeptidase
MITRRPRAVAQQYRDTFGRRLTQFDEIPTPPPAFDFAAATDDALVAEHDRIQARGGELAALETLTDVQATELTELASAADVVKGEISARTARAAAAAAARERFATIAPPAAPAAPELSANPVITPTTVTPAAEVVVPSVSQMTHQNPPLPSVHSSGRYAMAVTADTAGVTGKRFGEQYDNFAELSSAIAKIFGDMPKTSRGAGQSVSHNLALFTRLTDVEHVLPDNASAEQQHETLMAATSQRRFSGGGGLARSWGKAAEEAQSLTAAAGWCAPSENDYSLCTLWSMDGLIDLPTVTVRRGGLNYTQGLDYPTINVATGYTFLTEAQVIANTAKSCTPVPCPTFVNRRLDVSATCVTGSFLQAVGFPEAVDQFVDGALNRHARRINNTVIGQIVTQAGAVTAIPGPAGLGSEGTTSAVLNAVEIGATDLRYRYRMAFTATIEAIFPFWIIPLIRADLARRNAYASPFDVSDADIVRWFTVRNIRPQFVYDWQDGQATVTPDPLLVGGDGVAPYLTSLVPASGVVQFLLYPAGSVAVARQDVINLTSVYDAANIQQNLYTELFTEEGYAAVFPCPGQRLYSALVCPSGGTAAQVNLSCTAPA